MLKIKDSVDLKKIGCYISDDEFDQLWSYKELLFDKDTREIFQHQFFNDNSNKRLDILYELIKADMIEKLEGD